MKTILRIATLLLTILSFNYVVSMDLSESSDDTTLTTSSEVSPRSEYSVENKSRETSPTKLLSSKTKKSIKNNKPAESNINTLEQDIKNGCYAEALESLKTGKLEDFDALVGEASCQLRSVKVATIARKILSLGLHSLTAEEKEFITLSYLLTIAKAPLKEFDSEKRALLPDLLRKYFDGSKYPKIGRAPIQKIIQDAQRQLASLSVSFIQKLAASEEDEETQKALSHVLIDNPQTRFQRPHIGCYASISFILDFLLKYNYPLVILVRSWDKPLEEKLKLVYIPSNGSYVPANLNQLNPDEPVIVIGGYSNLINQSSQLVQDKFSELGLMNVILGTFATHPQFTGSEENKKSDIPYAALGLTKLLDRKNQHIKFAKENQCSLEHKDLFVSTHIYPSTVKFEFPNIIENAS